MAAYLICHVDRPEGPRSVEARRRLRARVRARWNAAAVEVCGLWILQADCTSDQIRDDLLRHLGSSQTLIVFALGRDAAWNGLGEADTNSLVEQIAY